MFAILKKEINTFFASATGYLVIAVFLLLNGLFLWVFKGNFNVFDYGFADLSAFFFLAPWILTFLIPAITMKSFSDEARMGTLEVLLTRPIHPIHIVLGKYLGAFTLVVLALLPTLLYILTLWKLGKPEGNLDLGSVLGSYVGLLFMASAYTAAGIFASTLSRNQIVSFIIAAAICFFLFFGFEGIASLGSEMNWISQLGMKAHFESMARGVIDTRDLIYFLSLAAFFVLLTSEQLKKTGNA
ncbi:gliding motility-associated ABC transporter permease subunit GldF [Ascidiimonas aurantiaca]|uniref:gliding motility-associated ABC transporter permease subunit GldF n=1 Tax=Ascidiimonas aurantiaca TaxID=1685432 RepID=UPI0030EB5F1B